VERDNPIDRDWREEGGGLGCIHPRGLHACVYCPGKGVCVCVVGLSCRPRLGNWAWGEDRYVVISLLCFCVFLVWH
jgi:hypothetical protein